MTKSTGTLRKSSGDSGVAYPSANTVTGADLYFSLLHESWTAPSFWPVVIASTLAAFMYALADWIRFFFT